MNTGVPHASLNATMVANCISVSCRFRMQCSRFFQNPLSHSVSQDEEYGLTCQIAQEPHAPDTLHRRLQ